MDLVKPGTLKWIGASDISLKSPMKAAEFKADSKLRDALIIKDRQQALARFKWNLDPGQSGLEINFEPLTLESMIFERGFIGAGVVEPGVLDIFPVAWCGGLDRYARMKKMKPVFPTGIDKEGKMTEAPFDKEFEIVYLPRKVDTRKGEEYGAVLFDYTPAGSRTGLKPRMYVQQEIVQEMSNLYNVSLVNLFNSVAIAKYHIGDADQADAIEDQLRTLTQDILAGKYYQVLKTTGELQDLTNPAKYNGQEYWQSFNSLDNLRLGFLGLVNTGAFNKKERKLEAESNVESTNSDYVKDNSLQERQKWCDAINSIYNTNFSLEAVRQEIVEGEEMDPMKEETDDNKEISEV